MCALCGWPVAVSWPGMWNLGECWVGVVSRRTLEGEGCPDVPCLVGRGCGRCWCGPELVPSLPSPGGSPSCLGQVWAWRSPQPWLSLFSPVVRAPAPHCPLSLVGIGVPRPHQRNLPETVATGCWGHQETPQPQGWPRTSPGTRADWAFNPRVPALRVLLPVHQPPAWGSQGPLNTLSPSVFSGVLLAVGMPLLGRTLPAA